MRRTASLAGAGVGMIISFAISLCFMSSYEPIWKTFPLYGTGIALGAFLFSRKDVAKLISDDGSSASGVSYLLGLATALVILGLGVGGDASGKATILIIAVLLLPLAKFPPTKTLDLLLIPFTYFGGILSGMMVGGISGTIDNGNVMLSLGMASFVGALSATMVGTFKFVFGKFKR